MLRQLFIVALLVTANKCISFLLNEISKWGVRHCKLILWNWDGRSQWKQLLRQQDVLFKLWNQLNYQTDGLSFLVLVDWGIKIYLCVQIKIHPVNDTPESNRAQFQLLSGLWLTGRSIISIISKADVDKTNGREMLEEWSQQAAYWQHPLPQQSRQTDRCPQKQPWLPCPSPCSISSIAPDLLMRSPLGCPDQSSTDWEASP